MKSTVVITSPQTSTAIFGDSIRIQKIHESIQKSGIEATHIQLPSIARNSLLRQENLKTVAQSILPLHKAKNPTPTFTSKSMILQAEFSLSMNHLVRKFKSLMPKVVLAETSQVGWITNVAAKKLSIPCIVDVHGLISAEAKGSGQENWQLIRDIEKEAFEHCDYLSVVSEKMKEYISKEFKTPIEKITVAPNGAEPQKSIARYKNPLKIIYAGIFSYWEKVNDFLDTAKQADRQTFKFYLAGTGPERNQLLRRINDEKIPVNYLSYVPKQKIHKLLAQMQVGISPSTNDLARQVASPIKVFDYMASGLPVVTPKIGDWGDMIQKENCGIALENDSVENYLKALDTLAQEDIWKTKSRNAIRSIEKQHNWTKALEPITNLLREYEK